MGHEENYVTVESVFVTGACNSSTTCCVISQNYSDVIYNKVKTETSENNIHSGTNNDIVAFGVNNWIMISGADGKIQHSLNHHTNSVNTLAWCDFPRNNLPASFFASAEIYSNTSSNDYCNILFSGGEDGETAMWMYLDKNIHGYDKKVMTNKSTLSEAEDDIHREVNRSNREWVCVLSLSYQTKNVYKNVSQREESNSSQFDDKKRNPVTNLAVIPSSENSIMVTSSSLDDIMLWRIDFHNDMILETTLLYHSFLHPTQILDSVTLIPLRPQESTYVEESHQEEENQYKKKLDYGMLLLCGGGVDGKVHLWLGNMRNLLYFTNENEGTEETNLMMKLRSQLLGHQDWIKAMDWIVIPVIEEDNGKEDILSSSTDVNVPKRIIGYNILLATGAQDGKIRIWKFVNLEEKLDSKFPSNEKESIDGENIDQEINLRNGVESDDEETDEQTGLKPIVDADEIDNKHEIRLVLKDAASRAKYGVILDAVLVGHEDWVTGLRWRPNVSLSKYLRFLPLCNKNDEPEKSYVGDQYKDIILMSVSMDRSLLLWKEENNNASISESDSLGIWTPFVRLGDLGADLGGPIGGNLLGFLGCSWGGYSMNRKLENQTTNLPLLNLNNVNSKTDNDNSSRNCYCKDNLNEVLAYGVGGAFHKWIGIRQKGNELNFDTSREAKSFEDNNNEWKISRLLSPDSINDSTWVADTFSSGHFDIVTGLLWGGSRTLSLEDRNTGNLEKNDLLQNQKHFVRKIYLEEDFTVPYKNDYLVTCSKDQTVRVWSPYHNNFLLHSSALTGEMLSTEEKKKILSKMDIIPRWVEVSRPLIHGYDLSCLAMCTKESENIPLHRLIVGGEEKHIRVYDATKKVLEIMQYLNQHKMITSKDSSSIGSDPNAFDWGMNDKMRFASAFIPALGLSTKAVYELKTSIENLQSIEKDIVGDAFSKHNKGVVPTNTDIDITTIENPTHNPDLDEDMEAERKATSTLSYDMRNRPPLDGELIDHTIWPETGKLFGPNNAVSCIALSGDGKILASACKARERNGAAISLWETTSGNWNKVGNLVCHTSTVLSLQFSKRSCRTNDEGNVIWSGGDMLASVSKDRSLCVFSLGLVNESTENKVQFHNNESLVSSDNKRCSTMIGKAHKRVIWSVSWAPSTLSFPSLSSSSSSSSIEDSGKRDDYKIEETEILCSGSRDGTFKIWKSILTGEKNNQVSNESKNARKWSVRLEEMASFSPSVKDAITVVSFAPYFYSLFDDDVHNQAGLLLSIGTENGMIEFWSGYVNLSTTSNQKEKEQDESLLDSNKNVSIFKWNSLGILPSQFCHLRSVKNFEWRQSHDDSSFIILNRQKTKDISDTDRVNKKMVVEYASSGEDHLVRINRVAILLNQPN